MKMKQDYLLLQKIEKKDAKIIIPETAQGVKGKDIEVFLVRKAGPGRFEAGKIVPMDVKEGDLVFITGFVSAQKDGETHIFGRERDVVAVF